MIRLVKYAVCVALAVAALSQFAWAIKPSTVAKLPGSAYVVRSAVDSDWLATWSEQVGGEYVLYVINGDDGERREVTTSERPGGICWIPNDGRLLLVKGSYNEKIEATHITYYTYDPETKELDKVISQTDLLETYRLDPIAANDGSSVFHLTMGPNSIPSFNRFLPEASLRVGWVGARVVAGPMTEKLTREFFIAAGRRGGRAARKTGVCRVNGGEQRVR